MRTTRPISLVMAALIVGVAATAGNAQVKIVPPPPGFPPPPPISNTEPLVADDKVPEHAAIRLGTTRLRVGNNLRLAQFTKDGKNIVAASSNSLMLYDASNGKPIRQLNRGGISFRQVDVSPDGTRMAITSYGNSIQIWDTATGQSLRMLKTPDANLRLHHVAFSPDGKRVAGSPDDFYSGNKALPPGHGVYVWDVEDSKQYGPFPVIHARQVQAVFSRDGKTLATYGGISYGTPQNQKDARTIQLWDVASGKEIRKLEGTHANMTSVAFSADGKKLATVTGRSTVSIWQADTGKLLRRFAGRAASSAFVEFSPDDKYLVVGNSSGMVQLWDTKTWKRLDASGPPCRATSVAFPDKDKVIACGIEGQAIRVWDVLTGKSLTPTDGHSYQIKSVDFLSGGKQVISVDLAGKICWWDSVKGKELRHRYLHEMDGISRPDGLYGPVHYALSVSPDGKFIAGYYNNGIRLWNLKTGQVLSDFESGSSSQSTVGFSPGSELLAIVNRDASVSVWNIQSGEELHNFQMRKDAPNVNVHINVNSARVVFSPKGDRLAASCYYYDNTINRSVYIVCLFDLATGKDIARFDLPSGVPAMDFSPDGKRLAIGSSTGIVVHSADNGKELQRLGGGVGSYAALAFAPDGRTLAAASQTYVSSRGAPVIYVWESATGQLRTQFNQGHTGPVMALGYSPDGRYIASGSHDTSILLWDLSGRHGPKPAANQPDFDALWESLAADDAARAFRAITELIAAGDKTVELLKAKLEPAKGLPLTAKEIQKLIADLDHPRFAVREKANHTLQNLGKLAMPELQAALKNTNSPEMEQRLAKLLDRLEREAHQSKELREIRAIEVLERLSTSPARQMLARLADGAPGATLTEQATAALQRSKQSE